MLTFTSGDMFEVPADIRVNTVNCVGVMGKGVALAFKSRYPEMFREYKKACERGEVRPGSMHIWKTLVGDWVINFPTKRHWKGKSKYEDIDSGLRALRDYLAKQGRVRVTLPALGCGHGGLDWSQVSKMIRERLSGLDAEILVFSPTDSIHLDQDQSDTLLRDSSSENKSLPVDVRSVFPGDSKYPEDLRRLNAGPISVAGNDDLLARPWLAVFASKRPAYRESKAVQACVDAISRFDITVALAHEAPGLIDVELYALEKGLRVVLCLADDVGSFRLAPSMEGYWGERKLALVSFAGSLRADREVLLGSRAVLFTHPELALSMESVLKDSWQRPTVFYINYGEIRHEVRSRLDSLGAIPIGRRPTTGKPRMDPVLAVLGVPGVDADGLNK